MRDGEATPLLRIGELARRAGIPPGTLRAWERRYGIVTPTRTEGGYRLYDEEDEARVSGMVALIERGVAPAQAADQMLVAERRAPAAERPALGPALVGELFAALVDLDGPKAEEIIDSAAARVSDRALIGELILPAMRLVGQGWANGEVTIGQEHFASNLARSRMLGIARGWGAGVGPLALLACPSGEMHDLGLIAFGIVLRSQGWRICFFGADTPPGTLEQAAADVEPEIVVLCALAADAFRRSEDSIVALATAMPVLLGGPGASSELAEGVGAIHLGGGALEAADAVARDNGSLWTRHANASSSTG